MNFSIARKLEVQFTKSIRKGYVKNVELKPDWAHIKAALDANEICIAKLKTKKGSYYYLTDSRIFLPDTYTWQFIRYNEIDTYHWITDSPESINPELKKAHYDRLILERANGEKVILEGLDQAVFCLIRFFRWI